MEIRSQEETFYRHRDLNPDLLVHIATSSTTGQQARGILCMINSKLMVICTNNPTF